MGAVRGGAVAVHVSQHLDDDHIVAAGDERRDHRIHLGGTARADVKHIRPGRPKLLRRPQRQRAAKPDEQGRQQPGTPPVGPGTARPTGKNCVRLGHNMNFAARFFV